MVGHTAGDQDYVAARDVIVRHINTLVPTLVSTAPVGETLRGVVASVNERNDSITVPAFAELFCVDGDFRVQDGLVFDAARYGDQIEFTVLVIDGAKTIVQIRKE